MTRRDLDFNYPYPDLPQLYRIPRFHSGDHSRPVPEPDHSECGGESIESIVSGQGKGYNERKFLSNSFQFSFKNT